MKTPLFASSAAAAGAPTLPSFVPRDAIFDEAVALIYAAGDAPALRHRALELIAQSLGATGAVYLSFADGQGLRGACECAGALPPDFAAQYLERGAALDPRRRFLAEAPADSLYVSHRDREPTDPRDALFFDGFLADCGIGESIGAEIAQRGRVSRLLFVERARGAPVFAAAELQLFRRLIRHWRVAERSADAARHRAAEEALRHRLLDTIQVGALIADTTRRVLFANAPAQELLAAADGLSLGDGRLQAARAFETNALSAHLRNAALVAPHDTATALLVARPSGKRPLALLIAPLLPVRAEDDLAAARMTVFVTDLEASDRDGRVAALAPRLTQAFGLSKAEARVAACVAAGLRLQEIARESDVRMPTVRTQLNAALRKIGVARQADLVRVAMALPATLAPVSSARIKSPAAALISIEKET